VWGLGAAVAAWLTYLATGAPIWEAIAELTGFLNLFNLVPVWQLDGARGFHALSRTERWIVVATIGLTLWLTGIRLLWLVGAVAAFQAPDPSWPSLPLVTFAVIELPPVSLLSFQRRTP
jgi:Zn-dependent protease